MSYTSVKYLAIYCLYLHMMSVLYKENCVLLSIQHIVIISVVIKTILRM